MDKLNTIYIISKDRPQCKSAKTLIQMEYPMDWFIVIGSDDKYIEEYKKNFGEDKIIIFDMEEQLKITDTLDNFGFENMAHGASPVRNVVQKISYERGEIRHWQIDDDFIRFDIRVPSNHFKRTKFNGKLLYKYLNKLSSFAESIGMANIGIAQGAETFPENTFRFSPRVFGVHNLPSEPDKFNTWRGRLNDDLINALEVYNNGNFEMLFYFLGFETERTQQESGGLTDIYKEQGTIRKTAYAIMINPLSVKLKIQYGRYHHIVNWRNVTPKIINEKWRKQ